MNVDENSVNMFASMYVLIPNSYIAHLGDAIARCDSSVPESLKVNRKDLKICNPFFYASVMNELLVSIVAEPAFDYLRTKACLGYSVRLYDCSFSNGPYFDDKTKGYIGVIIYVTSQANLHTINKCTGLIGAFWRRIVPCIINCMSEDEFQTAVESLIDVKREEDVNLQDVVGRDWAEVLNGSLMFDRRESDIKILENVEKLELVEFLKNAYHKDYTSEKMDNWPMPFHLITEVDANSRPSGVPEAKRARDYHVKLNYSLSSGGFEEAAEIAQKIEFDADVCDTHKCVAKSFDPISSGEYIHWDTFDSLRSEMVPL